MSEEARELHRIISASVRDMISAFSIQAQVGRVSEQALEGILFRDRRVESAQAERTP